jgi:hypothetical protein
MRDKKAISRRSLLAFLGILAFAPAARQALAAPAKLGFDQLYGKISVLGLEFSENVKALAGKR